MQKMRAIIADALLKLSAWVRPAAAPPVKPQDGPGPFRPQ